MQVKVYSTPSARLTLAATIMGLILVCISRPAIGAARQPVKHSFRVAGTYIEGCGCSVPCTCDMLGLKMGCQAIGAMSLTSGMFHGVNLAGARIAIGMTPGRWVRVYVDARNPRQQRAATEFARTAFKDYGKVESVKYVPISIGGRGGYYKLSVGGGKIIQLTTKPILGADKKTAIVYSNMPNPFTSVIKQGRTVFGSFNDGGHSFRLKGSNSYFNDRLNSRGKI